MTKQREIKERIDHILELMERRKIPRDVIQRQLLRYLHSQGVVIKIDKKPPKNPYTNSMGVFNYFTRYNTYQIATLRMLKDGYVAVAPIIEEGNDE